jgi:predicted DNA-binding transcriptional regulator
MEMIITEDREFLTFILPSLASKQYLLFSSTLIKAADFIKKPIDLSGEIEALAWIIQKEPIDKVFLDTQDLEEVIWIQHICNSKGTPLSLYYKDHEILLPSNALTKAELKILQFAQKTTKGLRVSEISQGLKLSIGPVSTTLGNLMQKGLIEKVKNQNDLRYQYIFLTIRGHRMLSIYGSSL